MMERIKGCEVYGVYYVVYRDGQVDPSISDQVRVTVEIRAPVEEGTIWLRSDLVYNQRLVLAGENMTRTWGHGVCNDDDDIEVDIVRKGYRYRMNEKSFYADTWREAFRLATEYAEAEMRGLLIVVEARANALIRAEVDSEGER